MTDQADGGVTKKSRVAELSPGVALCVGLFVLAHWLSGFLESVLVGFNPFTAPVLAILSGVVVVNTFTLGARFAPGIKFCLKVVLRLAIVLIGLRLSLVEVGELGLAGLPVVAIAVLSGVIGVELLGRALKLPQKLSMLVGAGTSICGVTAVVATAPVIEADEQDIAYAVANVTLFGLIGTLVYPYLVPTLLPLGKACGLFLGTAIHDTAQVMGAAAAYKDLYGDETGFATAAIAKMTRNLFLALVIPYFAWRAHSGDKERAKADRPAVFPMFLIGFLLMSCLRSVGDYTLSSRGLALGLLSEDSWTYLLRLLGGVWGSTWLVGFALAGVGLSLKFDMLKGSGLKPFVLGFSGALLVGFVSFLSIRAFL